jgi:hypothetical protein|tara:strand:- start:123 stop:353 length:231 start_codon:yes stop_codon:yes gene_type:complete
MGPLQDYYKKAMKEWKDFIEDPTDQDIKKQTVKCFGDNMAPVSKEMINKLLSRRVSSIRGAIDYHIQLLIMETKDV